MAPEVRGGPERRRNRDSAQGFIYGPGSVFMKLINFTRFSSNYTLNRSLLWTPSHAAPFGGNGAPLLWGGQRPCATEPEPTIDGGLLLAGGGGVNLEPLGDRRRRDGHSLAAPERVAASALNPLVGVG